MKQDLTNQTDFYGKLSPEKLALKYDTPLYVYNEQILRERCRQMVNLVKFPQIKVSYSAKANSNRQLLKIIHSEGLDTDAMSPGEIYLLLTAGFSPEQIIYIGNNVSDDELQFAIDHQVTVSIDSIAQLERFGRLNYGGEVAIRLNPGVGAGHHEKVVTGGEKTKFGVNIEDLPRMRQVLNQYQLQLIGMNQHIGSLFLEGREYLKAVEKLLTISKDYPDLKFVDFGGGFGVPYHHETGEQRLDLDQLGRNLGAYLNTWLRGQNREIDFRIEPGRYIVAESGRLLGRTHALKENHGTKYVGTDLGFNCLIRPILYEAYHELRLFREGRLVSGDVKQQVTVVGNICETGDIIAKERELPVVREGDLLEVMDAGAYGFAMSSNYNCRLRPAEVLIDSDGNDHLIRRRETFEDLMRCFNGYDF